MEIIYEDAEVLVAVKPAGVESEEARGLAPDMVNLVRKQLAVAGKGQPYVGLIRRLDKPVAGLMLFGKTPAAAAALSKELQAKKMEKCYRALVLGKPAEKSGRFTDWILQDKKENISRVVPKGAPGAKEAELTYRVLRSKFIGGKQVTEVELELLTGRRHQVRLQFASRNLPLLGDRKYGVSFPEQESLFGYGGLCLAATGLSFTHPKTRKRLRFRWEPAFKIAP